MLAGAFGLFVWELSVGGASLAEARTVVVNVIVMTELFYLLNCRSLPRSMLAVGFFSNRLLWFGVGGMLLAQLLFTYAPFMNRLFHTAPIGGEAWLRILAVGLTAYTLVGLEKWIRLHLAQGRGKTRDADLNL